MEQVHARPTGAGLRPPDRDCREGVDGVAAPRANSNGTGWKLPVRRAGHERVTTRNPRRGLGRRDGLDRPRRGPLRTVTIRLNVLLDNRTAKTRWKSALKRPASQTTGRGSMSLTVKRPPTKKDVVRVVSGNFLEMFDFMVYGFYAAAIAKAVFPNDNEFVSLMLSLMTFGIGFLMRPLGAIVLGAYIDRHGRRAGLIVSLGIMSAGVALIAFTPTYASIGLAAPILVLIGRLLQGFSAGAESGAVSVYLSEIATPGHRGFYVSWQSASQQVAVVFAAVIGVMLRGLLTEEQMVAWGWRIPFLIGCLIVPVLFWIRRSLQESEEFLERARRRRATLGEIYRSLAAELGHRAEGRPARHADQRVLLHDHRLHADLRQPGPRPERPRQLHPHGLCRHREFHLGARHGSRCPIASAACRCSWSSHCSSESPPIR